MSPRDKDAVEMNEINEIFRSFLKMDLNKLFGPVVSFSNPLLEISRRYREMQPLRSDPTLSDIVVKRISLDERRVMEFLQYASRWLPVNPNRPNMVKSVSSTYVPIRKEGPITAGNIANVQVEDGGFEFDSAIRDSNFILLTGSRGVGKTAFMNYWLNHKTKSLEAKGISWFRIDATKVHAIWQDNKSLSIPELYIKYFTVHSIYVLLRYSGELETVSAKDFHAVGKSELFTRLVSTIKLAKSDLVGNMSKAFVNFKRMDAVGPDPSVDIVERWVLHSTSRQDEDIEQLRQEFSKLFEDFSLKCLIIIDGIDNIAWTKGNSFYSKTCRYLAEITDGLIKAFGRNFSMILAARPETVFEVRHICGSANAQPTGFNWQKQSASLQEWRVLAPPAKDVIDKKIDAALQPDVFVNRRQEAASDSGMLQFLNTVLNELKTEVKPYPDTILNNLRDSLEFSLRGKPSARVQNCLRNLSEDNLLKVMFDDDLRAYIDNVISVFFERRDSMKRRGYSHAESQRLIMQSTYLNGRPFFNSREQYVRLDDRVSRANCQELGMVFPNIFWWPTETTLSTPNLWHGTAGYRLLQLAEQRGEFCCGDMLFALHELFGFRVVVLKEILESFVAFGLIEISNDSESSYFTTRELDTANLAGLKNIGRLTQKGIVFRSVLFSRPEVLYFYALDTPMKTQLVVDDTRFVKSHLEVTTGAVEEDFYSASIPTVATFLLHFIYFTTQESKNVSALPGTQSDVRGRLLVFFGGKEALLNELSIPSNIIYGFISWASRGLHTTPYRDKRRVDELRGTLIGVLGGATRWKYVV